MLGVRYANRESIIGEPDKGAEYNLYQYVPGKHQY